MPIFWIFYGYWRWILLVAIFKIISKRWWDVAGLYWTRLVFGTICFLPNTKIRIQMQKYFFLDIDTVDPHKINVSIYGIFSNWPLYLAGAGLNSFASYSLETMSVAQRRPPFSRFANVFAFPWFWASLNN